MIACEFSAVKTGINCTSNERKIPLDFKCPTVYPRLKSTGTGSIGLCGVYIMSRCAYKLDHTQSDSSMSVKEWIIEPMAKQRMLLYFTKDEGEEKYRGKKK